GSTSEFGYINSNKKGKLKFVSLLNKFAPQDRKFNYIRSLYATEAGIFFTTGEKLFRWNNKEMKTWQLNKYNSCNKIQNNIIVWQQNTGLSFIKKDSIVKLNGGIFFNNKTVKNILPYKSSKLLIVTEDSGIFVMDNPLKLKANMLPQITKFKTQAEYFIQHNQLKDCKELYGEKYAFATHRGGTAIIDNKGNLIQILDKKAGVQNETHFSIGQDNQNSIWLALDNGITRIDISAPLSYWNDEKGLKGSVLSIVRFQGKIFAGTYQGLYYHDFNPGNYSLSDDEFKKDISQFKLLKGINSTTWDMLIIKNIKNKNKDVLLTANTTGIFEIKDNRSIQIFKANSNKLYRSEKDSSKIFAGTDEGLICFSIDYSGDNLSFKYQGKVTAFEDRIVSIAEDNEGKLWITTEFNGTHMIDFSYKGTKSITLPFKENYTYKITHYDSIEGQPITYTTIYKVINKLLFVSDNNVFVPVQKILKNNITKIIFRHVLTFPFSYLNKTFNINNITEDKKGNIWVQLIDNFSGKKIIFEILRDKTGKYTLNIIPFKPIPQMQIYSILPENDNVTWIGGDDGLIRYDGNTKYAYNQEFHALIRKVIIEGDSVLFWGTYFKNKNDSGQYTGLSLNQPKELKPRISFAFNSLTFEYAAPSFYDEGAKMYQVFLEGFDKKPSEWTNETKKEYTNLPPGNYKFRVIAKNIFDTESTEAIYAFEILPPIYKSWYAYTFYILGIGFIIFSAYRYSSKRFRETKFRLEKIVKERTSEINDKKKEIEREKEKSDKLLLNILPFKIAQELKENGNAKTKVFNRVTVLFSDFKDFTIIAQQLEPQELISELNRCFVFFDDVCVRHNIEKIKTVGDSYMCAGGVPIKNDTNPVDMILAAFEMRDFISRLKKEQAKKGRTLWKIRIGVHTGNIISGVVGKKKFAYDIWGDTVNTASRLEQTSTPNRINISGTTYDLVKDFFDCTHRGKIPVKHKGEIEMYFVDQIKKELSVDDEGRIPNQKFWELYNKMISVNTIPDGL
ncbi:MAG: hypothetical protein HGB12_01910, partial [Bacteroidetes bacterium]|nr:hypothetical protein [Bacteroidota bacterium]